MASEKCSEGLIDEGGIRDSRPRTPGTAEEFRIHRRTEPYAIHAIIMPLPTHSGADKESNWLPAPTDRFILMLRLCWPTSTPPTILDGSWHIPRVKDVT